MKDNFNREINYLRISVTENCNLRCVYCMPEEGSCSASMPLSLDELIKIVKSSALAGIRKIRITGGEPLVRGDIVDLIKEISEIPQIEDIALTTNGLLLPNMAKDLKEAGLKRVNISLDTLSEEKYSQITRGGNLKKVLAGIEAAYENGFSPVKINTVVIRGFNDNEVLDFVNLSKKSPINIRFIELMPMTDKSAWADNYIPSYELLDMIDQKEKVIAQGHVFGNGPAKYYKIEGARGTIGFISPISNHFCDNCNRLRLTSDGKLRLCLHSNTETDLLAHIKEGATTIELAKIIEFAIANKPKKHKLDEELIDNNRTMNQIGG